MTESSSMERLDPPNAADEAGMLAAWLDFHRKTLAVKCAGLTAEQLRKRSVAPSSLTLLGLLRHLAEVEHYWYQVVLLGGDDISLYCEADRDGDFNDVDTADPDEAFATWRRQIELAEQAVAGLPLDTVGRKQRRNGDVTLRWIQVHMIEEYARHNGHADLLREAVDGVTGE
ncbi:DinB family protein [Kitasatospora acidiphila]|uniref:DinB family protein n=1 Tax=Kitasatospora acidiphila TaxID=2567942 RepID=A0A540VXH4_9ACTN|nr:DinB family protein [Kitasatospora acidiphila]TQF01453.1 DinB family protein [Kitasatospora acidiphila]